MSDDHKKVEHASFGLVSLSRVSAGGRGLALFDSPLRHHHFVRLRISEAYKVRNLNRDTVHDAGILFEADMSEVQFANFITSANTGPGTPCTLAYVMGKRIAECPPTHTRETFEGEVKRDLEELRATLDGLVALVAEVSAKPRLTGEDKGRLREAAEKAQMAVHSNIPFIHKQFTEAMDKTVSQARAEIQAHVAQVIQRAGVEGLIKAADAPRLEGGER
jgi:hypothetical protein